MLDAGCVTDGCLVGLVLVVVEVIFVVFTVFAVLLPISHLLIFRRSPTGIGRVIHVKAHNTFFLLLLGLFFIVSEDNGYENGLVLFSW